MIHYLCIFFIAIIVLSFYGVTYLIVKECLKDKLYVFLFILISLFCVLNLTILSFFE